uniref:MFS transporter n=1 Tax=Acetobacter nitrogenifigens TaxID=285268 RepID=UPI0003FEAF1C|nr:MFS transporter [Acetobacter nitrogenifigens]
MELGQPRAVRRFAPLLAAGFVAAYLDRVNISFAKDALAGAAGLTTGAFGFGAGLFFAGYVAAEVPANMAMVRVGGRVWLSSLLILWGFLSALTAAVSSPLQFYALRVLLGVVEAGFFPGAVAYLGRWTSVSGRGWTTAILLLAIPLSGVLGGVASGGIVAGLDGRLGLEGWRWLFLIEGALPVALGLTCFRLLVDDSGVPRAPGPGGVADVVSALLDRAVWRIALLDGANLLSLYLVTFWLPYSIGQRGVTSAFDNGLLSVCPSLLAIPCMLVNGWHSDLTRERRAHIAGPMVLGATALMLSGFAPSFWAFMVLVSVGEAGLLAAIPAYWSIPGSLGAGRDSAITIAVASAIANLAGMGSTMLAGYIISQPGGIRMAFVVLPLTTAVASLSVCRIPRWIAV